MLIFSTTALPLLRYCSIILLYLLNQILSVCILSLFSKFRTPNHMIRFRPAFLKYATSGAAFSSVVQQGQLVCRLQNCHTRRSHTTDQCPALSLQHNSQSFTSSLGPTQSGLSPWIRPEYETIASSFPSLPPRLLSRSMEGSDEGRKGAYIFLSIGTHPME